MVPVVAKVAEENRNTFAVAKYDMDDHKDAIGKYKVRGRPAYVIFRDGKLVVQFSGVFKEEILTKKILDELKKPL